MAAMRMAMLDLPAEESARFDAAQGILEQAQALVETNPGHAAALAWRGIMAANVASVRRDFSSLGLAKDARSDIEAAEQIDAAVLDSSVYSLLAYLYANVPGWPIGFGDEERADELFKRAIALNPDGAELHRGYGGFLMDQGEYDEAVTELEFALTAPLRVNASEPAPGISCRMSGCALYTDETDTEFRAGVGAQLAEARRKAR